MATEKPPSRWGRLSQSLRFRLTAWYTGVLAVIVLTGATFLQVQANRGLLSQADWFLSVEAQRIAESAAGRDGPDLNEVNEAVSSPTIVPDASHAQQSAPIGFIRFEVIYIRVLTKGGDRVLARSPDLVIHPELLPALDAQLSLGNPSDTRFAFAGADQGLMRVLTRPLPGGLHGLWLQVAVPWDSYRALLQRLQVALSIILPLLLVVTAAGSWVLVGRTLAPIQRIVLQAESLGEDNVFDVLLPQVETDTEIGHLVLTLNTMLGRLRKAFEAQKRYAEAQQRFAADASHELRTPLTILRGEMELALSRTRPVESYQTTIASAVEEIDRMSQIVQALSFLARQDALQLAAEAPKDPVDLVHLARTVVSELSIHAGEKQIVMDFGDDGPLTVPGNEGQLHQLARNLVENAIKYSPSGGQVHVRTQHRTGSVALSVEDTGIGISPEDLPHVFERFWRADRARTAAGSGLGLAISARIAEAHGGRLVASSTLGQGSRFEFVLPFTGSVATRVASSPAAPAVSSSTQV